MSHTHTENHPRRQPAQTRLAGRTANNSGRPGCSRASALAEGMRDAVRLVLREQESAGIDIVGDGEQTRRHFVTTLIENLDGVDFQHKKTVRIRNRYDADVPMVVGPVARTRPIFAEHAQFLRAETDRPVKYTLPGPMTMVDTLYDGYYRSREKLAREFAKILNAEARELEALGIDVIQFDEPAFNVFMDEVRDWGIETLEAAAAGLKCKTAVHICYGYGIKANNDWKKTLGSEWRQYESTFPLLREIENRPGIARMRQLQGAAGTDRSAQRQGHHGRRDRCRERGSRDAGESGADRARGAEVRRAGEALSLHQLRHGAVAARSRAGQTQGPGRGRGDRAQGARGRLTRYATANSRAG